MGRYQPAVEFILSHFLARFCRILPTAENSETDLDAGNYSMKFGLRPSEGLHRWHKVKLSVPPIVPQAHFTHAGTSHSAAAEHFVRKKTSFRMPFFVVKTSGLEPPTPCMSSKYSNQLSYAFIFCLIYYCLFIGNANFIKLAFPFGAGDGT